MKANVLKLGALMLVLGEVTTASAQEPKSEPIAAGRVMALQICASCHVVAEDQSSAPILKPPAPSFLAIAARQDVTQQFLRRFLAAPHGDLRRGNQMPNFLIADFQTDQIVAYLLSLKRN